MQYAVCSVHGALCIVNCAFCIAVCTAHGAVCLVQNALCNAILWSKFDSWWRTCSIPATLANCSQLQPLAFAWGELYSWKTRRNVLKRLGIVVNYQFWPWFNVKGTLLQPSPHPYSPFAAPSSPKGSDLFSQLKFIFLAQIWMFWGFLDPWNQNETYDTSNEDKIQHMNKTCWVDGESL